MGILRCVATGGRRSLGGRCLVGRAPHCALQLAHSFVSAEHAVLSWHGDGWYVRDLASTNGTFVDGKPARPGERRAVPEGAVIQFGKDEGPRWKLEVATPPGPSAVSRESGKRLHGSDLLLLPSPDDPELTVFVGDDGTWICETEGEPKSVTDGARVWTSVGQWTLELPPPELGALSATEEHAPDTVESIGLSFRVSADEEFVEVAAHLASGEVRRLSPRSFHYMLLTLARARVRDAESGLPVAEQGWMYADQLADALGVMRQKLNLDVSRARQQVAEAGIEGAGRLIQRRATSRQIRIGVTSLDVRRA